MKREELEDLFEEIKSQITEDVNIRNIQWNYQLAADYKVAGLCRQISDKYFEIVVDPSVLNEENAKSIIAHEICHTLERTYGYRILGTKDFEEIVDLAKDTNNNKFYEDIEYLAYEFKNLHNSWVDEEEADSWERMIEMSLEKIEKYKEEYPEYKEVWKWFSKNFDALYDSLDYYGVGGHNSKWFDYKKKYEKILGIKIPTAEIV